MLPFFQLFLASLPSRHVISDQGLVLTGLDLARLLSMISGLAINAKDKAAVLIGTPNFIINCYQLT